MMKEILPMIAAILISSYISFGITIAIVAHHVDKHHKVEITCP